MPETETTTVKGQGGGENKHNSLLKITRPRPGSVRVARMKGCQIWTTEIVSQTGCSFQQQKQKKKKKGAKKIIKRVSVFVFVSSVATGRRRKYFQTVDSEASVNKWTLYGCTRKRKTKLLVFSSVGEIFIFGTHFSINI